MAANEEKLQKVQDEIDKLKAKIEELEKDDKNHPRLPGLQLELAALREEKNLLLRAAQGASVSTLAVHTHRQQPPVAAGAASRAGSVAGGAAAAPTAAPEAPLADSSVQVADALFAPFASDSFPMLLERARLQNLLSQPPAATVPVPPQYALDVPALWREDITGGALFISSSSSAALRLFPKLYVGLTEQWPLGDTSELELLNYWNTIGYTLPEFASNLLQFGAAVRSDYYITLGGVVVVGGEDKASSSNYQTALQECISKHKGANAVMYGRLCYILLTVMAGDRFGVYAMPLSGDCSAQEILPAFSVRTQAGRCKAMLTFINLTRWVRTVQHCGLLPPAHALIMFQPVSRPAPYPDCAPTQLTLGLRSVHKVMVVPKAHLQRLLDVYGLLINVPGAIRCAAFKVDGTAMTLHPPTPAPPSTRVSRKQHHGECIVLLKLQPPGALWVLASVGELRNLCRDLLVTLEAVHNGGFVHRDVRKENIVRSSADKFMLIDWELASRSNEAVFWQAPPGRMPLDVGMGSPWQPWMDLRQLGLVVKAERPYAQDPLMSAFTEGLLTRSWNSAGQALAELPGGAA